MKYIKIYVYVPSSEHYSLLRGTGITWAGSSVNFGDGQNLFQLVYTLRIRYIVRNKGITG
jgi:hypothetical protein